MGTKVAGKSYLPGYFAMGDWEHCYEQKTHNVNLYGSSPMMPTNGYSEYDREMLKRTMLVHEATFRRQVYELHRLYKRQKDLMTQFRKEDQNGCPRPTERLQPYFYAAQSTSEDTKMMFQMSLCSNSNDRASTSGRDNGQTYVDFLKDNNGCRLKVDNDRFEKRTLDLQLPADAYADSEDVQIVEKKDLIETYVKPIRTFAEMNSTNNGDHFNPILGTSKENISVANLLSRNNQLGHRVADLNEPAPTFTDFLGIGTSSAQNRSDSPRQRNSMQSLGNDFRDRHAGEASTSNFFYANGGDFRQCRLFNNTENDGNIGMASFRQRPNDGVESSSGNYSSASLVVVPQCPSNIDMLTGNLNISTEAINTQKWKEHADSGDRARPGSGATSLNGFCNGYSLASIHTHHQQRLLKIPNQCLGANESSVHRPMSSYLTKDFERTDANCAKEVNLNEPPLDKIQDGTNGNRDYRRTNSPFGTALFIKKADCTEMGGMKSQMAFSLTNDHSGAMLSSGAVVDELERRPEKVLDQYISKMQGFALTSQDKVCQSEWNKGSNGSASTILGSPIGVEVENGYTFSSIPHVEQSFTVSRRKNETNVSSERQVQRMEVGSAIRTHIDLNNALPCMDDLESLEAPLGSQEVASTAGTKLGSDTDIRQVEESQDSSLAIMAAENILAISRNAQSSVIPPDLGTLHWFAELATSKEQIHVPSDDSEHDELDTFESITLELQETKMDEYLCMLRIPEQKNNKGPGASLLLTRPRRGRARKCRQQRNFQKDILPGLASLSKHEVSEDIETLGVSLPKSSTRRGGRNASRGKGRGRPRSVPAIEEEVHVSSPLQPAAADLDADEGESMLGWGRTTRRCRRPRCPPGNVSVHFD